MTPSSPLPNPPARVRALLTGMLAASACLWGPSQAAAIDPGRLFYTPEQRAQLESARARKPAPTLQAQPGDAGSMPPPLRYDGVLIRSDGKTTRWVDGKPQVGASGVTGLKPGQIRAAGKVLESYQVLQPTPAGAADDRTGKTAP